MFRRSAKQTKTKVDNEKKNAHRMNRKDARKGRGKRAQETIREVPQKGTSHTSKKSDAGPPLRIPKNGKKTENRQTTPDEVVRNIRGGKR